MESGRLRKSAALAQRRWRRLAWIAAATLLATACWFRDGLATAAGRWLDVGESPSRTDVCLVLPGDYNSRPFVAAALFKASLVRHILVPKGLPHPGDSELKYPSEDEVVTRVVTSRGVPISAVTVLDFKSTSTVDDVQALRMWLQSHECESVTLITSDFHTRRTRWIFRRMLADSRVRLVMVSAPCDACQANDWWQSADGFLTYSTEFVKFAYYGIRFGNSGIWLAAIAMGALVYAALRLRRKGMPVVPCYGREPGGAA